MTSGGADDVGIIKAEPSCNDIDDHNGAEHDDQTMHFEFDLDEVASICGELVQPFQHRNAGHSSQNSHSTSQSGSLGGASKTKSHLLKIFDPTKAAQSEKSKGVKTYDLFLSHLQRNGQDAIISMQMFLQQAMPGIKIFIDLDVDMKGDLTGTLEDGVKNCGAFVFFITDGILTSEWCAQELRWAVKFEKKIVLVRETDERHGGLDMGLFLKQVPEDLLPVFKNNIAIPWYRQPAFRTVSIQSILKAADIEDSYNKDLKSLSRTKAKLLEAFAGKDDPTTCVDIIEQASWAMRVVFFFGGFTQFKNRKLDWIYVIAFNLSFWICGSLCTANLIYQTVPYHVIGTDILTAYVHLPAWQSWLLWRRFVHSRGTDELLTKVTKSEESAKIINVSCRVVGWLVLVLQLAMVADVLLGFSLPGSLELGGEPGTEFGNDHPGAEVFTHSHAWAMWALIPGVVASMFASYTMFAFVALLHILDINNVKGTLSESIEILRNFYNSDASPYKNTAIRKPGSLRDVTPSQPLAAGEDRDSVRADVQSAASWSCQVSEAASVNDSQQNVIVDDMQAQLRKVAMEELLFKTVCELLIQLFKTCQNRMDHTCKALSGVWLHLVFFSTCQVLAISQALTMHAAGTLKVEYHWWYALQDFFHLGGGFVLLTAAMGVFCVVTSYFKVVRLNTMSVLMKAGCPAPRQASVMSLLLARPLGMSVLWGTTFIDVPKALGFFTLILSICINNFIALFNGIDYK